MLKVFLLCLLLGCPVALRAQETPPPTAPYADAQAGYRLRYPRTWLARPEASGTEVTFSADGPRYPAPAVVTLTVQPVSGAAKRPLPTPAAEMDSLWRGIRRLPRSVVAHISPHRYGTYTELRYDYTYAPAPPDSGRLHVVGRLLRRDSTTLFRLEYRAPTTQDGRYLAEGRELLESFTLGEAAPAPPPAAKADSTQTAASPRPAGLRCNNKLYGIAAVRYHRGDWEDDCRSIHEFDFDDLSAPPVVHSRVLPFQSYALAQGFDNCLYAVSKSPTDQPERVYRYNPTTRQGEYTSWLLPAQGPDVVWISAATDADGNIYFLSSDANLLVRITPATGKVAPIWTADPLQKASYYRAIAFAHAGTHGNFCFDDTGTVFMVYSTDGALLRVDLKTRRPAPELMPLDGLPHRGGYSDVLFQNDANGRRQLYLAGPKALYKIDVARRRASRVRQGTYTDLAGCNIFRTPPPPPPPPAPAPPPPAPTTARWQGRVLDARTRQPLPQAQLRQVAGSGERLLRLSPQGIFSIGGIPGATYTVQARLAGYVVADSAFIAAPGAVVRDILLQPLAVGTTLSLAQVQFEQGTATLLPTSAPALNQLVKLLTDNPHLTIELRGHTDNIGPPEKNQVLSEQRVAAVKAYLVAHGLAESRITGLGFGGTQPVASNEKEVTRKLNRRVEFRVTSVQ